MCGGCQYQHVSRGPNVRDFRRPSECCTCVSVQRLVHLSRTNSELPPVLETAVSSSRQSTCRIRVERDTAARKRKEFDNLKRLMTRREREHKERMEALYMMVRTTFPSEYQGHSDTLLKYRVARVPQHGVVQNPTPFVVRAELV